MTPLLSLRTSLSCAGASSDLYLCVPSEQAAVCLAFLRPQPATVPALCGCHSALVLAANLLWSPMAGLNVGMRFTVGLADLDSPICFFSTVYNFRGQPTNQVLVSSFLQDSECSGELECSCGLFQ